MYIQYGIFYFFFMRIIRYPFGISLGTSKLKGVGLGGDFNEFPNPNPVRRVVSVARSRQE